MTPNEIRDHMVLVLVDIDEEEMTDRFLDMLGEYAAMLRRLHSEGEVRRKVARLTLEVIRRLDKIEAQSCKAIGRA